MNEPDDREELMHQLARWKLDAEADMKVRRHALCKDDAAMVIGQVEWEARFLRAIAGLEAAEQRAKDREAEHQRDRASAAILVRTARRERDDARVALNLAERRAEQAERERDEAWDLLQNTYGVDLACDLAGDDPVEHVTLLDGIAQLGDIAQSRRELWEAAERRAEQAEARAETVVEQMHETEKVVSGWHAEYRAMQIKRDEWKDRAEQAEAACRAKDEALGPFAEFAEGLSGEKADTAVTWRPGGILSVYEFRDAKAALSPDAGAGKVPCAACAAKDDALSRLETIVCDLDLGWGDWRKESLEGMKALIEEAAAIIAGFSTGAGKVPVDADADELARLRLYAQVIKPFRDEGAARLRRVGDDLRAGVRAPRWLVQALRMLADALAAGEEGGHV